ncbi:MAG: GNAT family N-acetyltransferase [Kiritimatiellia bacterium]|nr:GNAT family N-acetyltransferase [Kiritimatiellia bacterium]MDP6849269.1 GNAT family N-acetyltransferase [Kiritimatiellia bacterium]
MAESVYSIRPAEFKDAEAIFRLIKSSPEELIPRAISDIVQNIDRCIVAEADGEVIGTLSWQVLPEIGAASEQHVIEIKSVAVNTEHRHKGIGRSLVEAGVERTRPLHMSQIIVLTFTPDFFQTLGFKEIPKETLMHKIYMGCINCTKYDSPFTCPEVAMALDVSAEA